MKDHLILAAEAVAKGDAFYATAAKHMLAARDEGKTEREIAEAVGKSQTWVHDTLKSYLRAERPDVLAVKWHRGTHATKKEIENGAAKILADPKQRAKVIDALPAKEQAKIATDLTAKTEVREEILKAGPLAVDQHYKVTDEAIKRKIKKQEHDVKKKRPVVAGKTAADYIGEAAELLTRALQEVNEYGVEMKHDRLGRIESGLKRVKRYTKEIEAALDVEIEDTDEDTTDLYIA